MKNSWVILFSGLLVLYTACFNTDENITPKPKGYFRINLPKQEYIQTNLNCPFNFLVSNQTVFEKHHSNNVCWYNIVYPRLNATIHISYYSMNKNLKDLTENTRGLVYKHTSKAQYINEKQIFDSDKKVYGILYEIGGNAASNCQFFVTDSVKHYVRGALYFNNKPNIDSIAPVLDYIKGDIITLMESIRWSDK